MSVDSGNSLKAILENCKKIDSERRIKQRKWQNVLPMFYLCSKIKIPDLLKGAVSLVAGAGLLVPLTAGLVIRLVGALQRKALPHFVRLRAFFVPQICKQASNLVHKKSPDVIRQGFS
jgi:hypothetical protein